MFGSKDQNGHDLGAFARVTPDEIDERIGVLRQRRRAASNEITRQMRRGNELLRLAAIARRDRDEIDAEIQKLESQKVKGKR